MENYTSGVETDPNSHIVVDSATQITFAGLTRTESAHVIIDKGAAHFDNDYSHTNEFEHDDTAADQVFCMWQLSNVADDPNAVDVGGGDSHFAHWSVVTGTIARMYVNEVIAGAKTTVNTGNDLGGAVAGTTYYLREIRDEEIGDDGELKLQIYSDSDRSTLLKELTILLGEKEDFRYVTGGSSYSVGGGGAFSGKVRNLDLGEGVGAVLLQKFINHASPMGMVLPMETK